MKLKQNKRGLMLLSLLIAFFVWLGVANVADPVRTDTVEVPVEIINDAVFTSNNLTYEIVGKKTATVSYEVKTTNAHRMRASDFRAYADATDMWEVTGSIPIKVEVLNHGEYLVSAPVSRTTTITLATEPLQRKQFEIGHKIVGKMEADYEPGTVTVEPATLYVEGPESLIGQISSVGIEIPVDGVSAEVEDAAMVKYYDANGNEIPLNERITSDCSSVTYHMTVLKGKNLPLDFQVSGTVAGGYRFTGVESEVKSVAVVGLRSVLASVHTLTIPGEALNLGGARENVVKTVNLSEYLPEGIVLADSVPEEIQVTLTVEPLVDRVFDVEINDSSFVGEHDDYVYRAKPEVVQVTVRALKEELDSLELDASDVEINVANLTVGEHTVSAAVHVDQAYKIVSVSPFVIEVLRLADPNSETTAPGPGAESSQAPQTETPPETEGEEESQTSALVIPADAPGGESAPDPTDESSGEASFEGNESSQGASAS